MFGLGGKFLQFHGSKPTCDKGESDIVTNKGVIEALKLSNNGVASMAPTVQSLESFLILLTCYLHLVFPYSTVRIGHYS